MVKTFTVVHKIPRYLLFYYKIYFVVMMKRLYNSSSGRKKEPFGEIEKLNNVIIVKHPNKFL